MNIENRYQELALNIQKKLIIFEGLKDQLNSKILQTGLEALDQPVLLSSAVMPFGKYFPIKVGLILALIRNFIDDIYLLDSRLKENYTHCLK